MRRRRQEENLLLEREKLEDEQQLQSLLTAQHQKKVEQIADLSKVFIKSSQSQTIYMLLHMVMCVSGTYSKRLLPIFFRRSLIKKGKNPNA